VPFTALVPASLASASMPGRALGYGHGFFGNREELVGAPASHIADRLAAVAFSIDWWGMSDVDLPDVGERFTSAPSQALSFSDRLHQAMASWTVMTAAIRGPLAAEAAFHRPTGQPLYDTSAVYFLGISLGHILGGVLAAFDPDLSRVCLQVGGAGFTHIMFRSRPFGALLGVLQIILPDALDQEKFAALSQSVFDRFDPAFYAKYLLAAPLPGSPSERRVLLQTGLGDDEVPNLASFLHARLLGLPEVSPNAFPVWGLAQSSAPPGGSGITVWDLGINLGYYNDPEPAMTENGVHSGLRMLDSTISQMDQFFRPNGAIVNPCGGVCTGTL
jgi:hypothetical protein